MGTLKAAASSNAPFMSVTDDTSQPPMGALKAASWNNSYMLVTLDVSHLLMGPYLPSTLAGLAIQSKTAVRSSSRSAKAPPASAETRHVFFFLSYSQPSV